MRLRRGRPRRRQGASGALTCLREAGDGDLHGHERPRSAPDRWGGAEKCDRIEAFVQVRGAEFCPGSQFSCSRLSSQHLTGAEGDSSPASPLHPPSIPDGEELKICVYQFLPSSESMPLLALSSSFPGGK